MTLKSIDKYLAAYDMPAGYPWVKNMLEEIVLEVRDHYEQVVHCRDCRFRDVSHCSMTGDYVRSNDYCSFGAKGGEDD